MAKQINLDSWQSKHLASLLERGSRIVRSTGTPIVLYRQTMEEEGESYEEIVCTLACGYVVEQRITAGGLVRLTVNEQTVFSVGEYPGVLLQKSRERFQEVIDLLESADDPP